MEKRYKEIINIIHPGNMPEHQGFKKKKNYSTYKEYIMWKGESYQTYM